jgi:hypothetical protein
MKIIDTYPEIVSLFDRMEGKFNIALWEEYISGISRELCNKLKEDSSQYDFQREILPVLSQAMVKREKLKTAHASFCASVKGLAGKVKKITGTQLQVDIIFYLGLCNGAGWATKLENIPTILLGIEKIVELDWCDEKTMASLIYHELGHIWHDSAGSLYQKTGTTREKYILQLYQEGIAMYFEQLILDDFTHYHQHKGNWLNWCHANKRELDKEYLRRLNANESAQDFFGDWCAYQGYSDVGYFIGCEFIKHLAEKFSLRELAALDLNTVYQEFSEYAL